MKVIYKSAETRGKQNEIHAAIRLGLVLEIENGNTHEKSYMLNERMVNTLLKLIPIENMIEYDGELNVYTCYNSMVPSLFGEGESEEEAKESMVEEAMALAQDHIDDPSIFSGVLNEIQQFVMANLALAGSNKDRVKEILNIG